MNNSYLRSYDTENFIRKLNDVVLCLQKLTI
jgi:hypothetical protein